MVLKALRQEEGRSRGKSFCQNLPDLASDHLTHSRGQSTPEGVIKNRRNIDRARGRGAKDLTIINPALIYNADWGVTPPTRQRPPPPPPQSGTARPNRLRRPRIPRTTPPLSMTTCSHTHRDPIASSQLHGRRPLGLRQ
jgi:hypothetical protein